MTPDPSFGILFPIKSDSFPSDKSARKIASWNIVWRNVFLMAAIHVVFLHFLYLLLTFKIKAGTLIFTIIYIHFTALGVTAGAHRLWAHKSYKANLPLRMFLMLAQTAALQNSIFEWVRDHRVHHKFSDTNADPHNSERGFFFSHVGWLLVRKHRDVIAKGQSVHMDDLLQDPLVRFQKKYYIPLIVLLHTAVPTLIPCYFLGQDLLTSMVTNMGRYVFVLNCTWLVNSAAHLWGMRPYDKTIKPAENRFVSSFTVGEGWHNYHHAFPWDYKAAELGITSFTTYFLDCMAKIGWATDLKTASQEIIKQRRFRTGERTARK